MHCHDISYPISLLSSNVAEEPVSAVVAVVRVSDHNKEGQDSGETLAERQRMDPSLRQVIIYLNDFTRR